MKGLKPIQTYVLIIWMAMVTLTGWPVHSAIISIGSEDGCGINLAGEIVDGDFLKLQKVAKALGLISENLEAFHDSANRALCLDSPGGSYLEGRLLSELIHKNGIATRVVSGAECYSSCAFIFMAGRALGVENDGPRRILHINGKLGFHAPYFDFDDLATFSGQELEEITRLNSLIIGELIQFGSYSSIFNSKPMFSLSLLGELLVDGLGELSFVDTVEEVARWEIQLEGQVQNTVLSESELKQACINFQQWNLDRPSHTPKESWHNPISSIEKSGRKFVRIDTGGLAERFCHISLNEEPVSGLSICSYDGFNGMLLGDCSGRMAIFVPWYYGLPPNAPLRELAFRTEGKNPYFGLDGETSTKNTSQIDTTGMRKSCFLNGKDVYVSNVQNFVNLREAPGFESKILAKISLNAKLSSGRLNLVYFFGSPELKESCRLTCDILRSNITIRDDELKWNVEQCFVNNLIWHRLRDEFGNIGYVSGKFLRY